MNYIYDIMPVFEYILKQVTKRLEPTIEKDISDQIEQENKQVDEEVRLAQQNKETREGMTVLLVLVFIILIGILVLSLIW